MTNRIESKKVNLEKMKRMFEKEKNIKVDSKTFQHLINLQNSDILIDEYIQKSEFKHNIWQIIRESNFQTWDEKKEWYNSLFIKRRKSGRSPVADHIKGFNQRRCSSAAISKKETINNDILPKVTVKKKFIVKKKRSEQQEDSYSHRSILSLSHQNIPKFKPM